MKVACVLYGQPRDYLQGYKNIMEFCKKQTHCEFDFFYHCWTLAADEKYSVSPWRHIDESLKKCNNNICDDLIKLYNPVCFEYNNQINTFDVSSLENTIGFDNTKVRSHIFHNVYNTLSNIYSKNKARNLLNRYINETNIHYDCVIMVRFDIRVMLDISLSEFNPLRTYVADLHYPRKIISDSCIITNTATFLNWFNIYEELQQILNDKNLLKLVESYGETVMVNPEELVFANYLRYNSLDNIIYIKGGLF